MCSREVFSFISMEKQITEAAITGGNYKQKLTLCDFAVGTIRPFRVKRFNCYVNLIRAPFRYFVGSVVFSGCS